MTIDAARYPRAAAYYAQLPAGMDSFSDYLVRVDGRENLIKDFGALAEDATLPQPVRTYLSGGVREAWMPEVISVMTLALARDVMLPSDEALRTWAYDDAISVFKKPMYKMLMFVMSPTLVVMSASKRWNTWRSNSTLSADPVKQEGGRFVTRLILTAPAQLYDDTSLTQLGQVYVAAATAAGGKDAQLHWAVTTPGTVGYTVSWVS